MRSLFGTDGIRGHAGEFPLDEKTVWTIGASLARLMSERLGRGPRFVTGRDTRESGGWIENAFHAGALSAGAECLSAAVITTPGVAYLTGAFGLDAGIVISASHNPFQDNGIKIFLPTGQKIDDATEREIERDIFNDSGSAAATVAPADAGRAAELRAVYVEHLVASSEPFSTPLKIVIDCANGAASDLAPSVFAGLNIDVVAINREPDGRNINENCGSLHLEKLRAKVLEAGADLGVAFDGDADRALFVDENGEIVDGDATLWIMARYLKGHGKLANSQVVATVMSNIGLEIAMRSVGVELLRAPVGDKYVLEKLLETGSEIGGEQSGHIIFPENSLVGDGMMTALLVLRAIREKGESLSRLASGFQRYPQILVNVKVREKRPFEDVAAIAEASREIESELHGEGRLLLRYSGTENLARVMIEGKDQSQVDEQAHRLADVIRKELG